MKTDNKYKKFKGEITKVLPSITDDEAFALFIEMGGVSAKEMAVGIKYILDNNIKL